MTSDLIQCPLCEGLSHVRREQLIHVLRDPALLSKVESLLDQLAAGSDLHPEPVPAAVGASDFETKVHSWNPKNPMWNRSPKE